MAATPIGKPVNDFKEGPSVGKLPVFMKPVLLIFWQELAISISAAGSKQDFIFMIIKFIFRN